LSANVQRAARSMDSPYREAKVSGMRILMLAQSYDPIVGGEERLVEDLSAELARRGHDVAVATLRQPAGESHNEGTAVRIHTMRSSVYRLRRLYGERERLHAPPAPDPETVLDLRRILRQERPDVVHAHNWLVHSYIPLDRRSDAALVLSLHDYGLLCATKRLMYRDAKCSGPRPVKCMRCAADHYGTGKGAAIALGTRLGGARLRRHVDVFLPVSKAVKELCRLGPGDAHRVVSNFIRDTPPKRLSDDPRLAELPHEPFVLFFGDVTTDKGAWHLAEVHRELERPPPLVFIGRPYLSELADRPGVTLVGPWPHELVLEALGRCLLVAVPSVWPEPFGLVALETAAAGKPIVASDIGGLKDIVIDEVTGLLVPPGDRDSLRLALQRLIADGRLRTRLGEAAARRASAFSSEVVVPQFEAAYELAVKARRSRPRSSRH
jgi:glycosyltransferase involved in cell wall biosynthesis